MRIREQRLDQALKGQCERLPEGLMLQVANGAARTDTVAEQRGSVGYWSDGRRVHDFQNVTDRTLPARGADVHILLSSLRSDRGAYRQPGCLYPIAAAVKRDQLFPVRLLPAQVTRAMLNRFSPLSHHVPPLVCLQPAERLALRREPEGSGLKPFKAQPSKQPPLPHHTDPRVQPDLVVGLPEP